MNEHACVQQPFIYEQGFDSILQAPVALFPVTPSQYERSKRVEE